MSTELKNRVRLIDGQLFDPWDPAQAHPNAYVPPETVAYHLARLNRYGGGTKRLYSVACHSIWGAMYLLTEGESDSLRRQLCWVVRKGDWQQLEHYIASHGTPHKALRALHFLVHDSPEGLGLVDVPGPICRRPEMAPYREAHKRCLTWLLDRWRIPQIPSDSDIWQIDTAILGGERPIRPPVGDGHRGSSEESPLWPWFDVEGLCFPWLEVPNPLGAANHVDGTIRHALPQESAWMMLYVRLRHAAGLPRLTAQGEINHPARF